MAAILDIIAPVFALILVGYGTARTKFWSPPATAGFNRFVFYIALPALLFAKLGSGRAFDMTNLAVAVAYFGGSVISIGVAAAIGRAVFRLSAEDAAMLGMGSGFSNTVLLGLPIVILAFGDAAVPPITAIIGLNSIIIIPVITIMIEISRRGDGDRGWRQAIAAPLGGLVRNPILIAIAAGTLWGLTGFGLAGPFERFIALLSGAAGPCALFALGAGLAGYKVGGHLPQVSLVVAAKLVAHPVIVWLLCRHLLSLDAQTTGAVSLMAAIPVGATVFVVAQENQAFVGQTSSAILMSTGLSAATLSVAIALLA